MLDSNKKDQRPARFESQPPKVTRPLREKEPDVVPLRARNEETKQMSAIEILRSRSKAPQIESKEPQAPPKLENNNPFANMGAR